MVLNDSKFSAPLTLFRPCTFCRYKPKDCSRVCHSELNPACSICLGQNNERWYVWAMSCRLLNIVLDVEVTRPLNAGNGLDKLLEPILLVPQLFTWTHRLHVEPRHRRLLQKLLEMCATNWSCQALKHMLRHLYDWLTHAMNCYGCSKKKKWDHSQKLRGNRYILTVNEYFLRWHEARAIADHRATTA